ncbi:MAG TPA: hypothetical protein VFX78_01655 [Candidatus Eisenbacteria bacterium]|nr:hypothetical protein [Candidatus Eisenbacteria bacterium]
MIRNRLIVGIIAVTCAPSVEALADVSGGWDSTTVISIPADSLAIVSTPADSAAVLSTPADTATVSAPGVLVAPASPVGMLPTRADSIAFQSVIRRVKPHATARVLSSRDTVIVKGQDMSYQGVQRYGHPDSTLGWADVKQVQRRGSAAGQGAMVGAIAFGALGMIAGASESNNSSSQASGAEVVAGTLVSAAAGALLGALVAAPVKRWKNVDLDSPEGGFFNDSRRGFTLEVGAGPGFTNESNGFSETDRGTEFAGVTRFRLGYGFSERYSVAYVNDVAWNGDVTGITGLGLSYFSAPGTPSWVLEVTGGVAGRADEDDSASNFGMQGGLGIEFSRHWIARASAMYVSIGDDNHTMVGTSISRLWY